MLAVNCTSIGENIPEESAGQGVCGSECAEHLVCCCSAVYSRLCPGAGQYFEHVGSPSLQVRQPISARQALQRQLHDHKSRDTFRRAIEGNAIMSFYFAIVGTLDNPLFEYEFGSSKQGGDGIARFPEQARHMNQFIVHSSLDIVEEVQWGTGQL